MIKTKSLLTVLIPAILIAGFTLFVRVIQYEPLFPEIDESGKIAAEKTGLITIPVYPKDPVIGDKKASKTIVVFEDFGCDHCKEQFSVMGQFLTKHPNVVKIIWKGLPVSKFPYPSDLAHEYAQCLNEQGQFINFAELAFTNGHQLKKDILDMIVQGLEINEKKFNACLTSTEPKEQIERTKQIAKLLNIQTVPTVFLDNKQINPPATVEGWEAALGI